MYELKPRYMLLIGLITLIIFIKFEAGVDKSGWAESKRVHTIQNNYNEFCGGRELEDIRTNSNGIFKRKYGVYHFTFKTTYTCVSVFDNMGITDLKEMTWGRGLEVLRLWQNRLDLAKQIKERR